MSDHVDNYAEGLMAGDALVGIRVAAILDGVTPETRYHAICRKVDGSIRWEADAKNRVTTAGLNKLLDATFKTGLAAPLWYVGLVGQSVADAAITASSPNLTSASNLWQSGDAGRNIIVRGAGASGNDLLTTILTYSSAGAVVLAASAGTTVSAALAVWEARLADTMASHASWTNQSNYLNAPDVRPTFTPGTIASGSVDNSLSPAVFNISADNVYIGGLHMSDNNVRGGATGTLYGMAVWTSGGFRQSFSGDTITITGTISCTAT